MSEWIGNNLLYFYGNFREKKMAKSYFKQEHDLGM
jgi:hypothetical protein